VFLQKISPDLAKGTDFLFSTGHDQLILGESSIKDN
jgi:hypothetical protein